MKHLLLFLVLLFGTPSFANNTFSIASFTETPTLEISGVEIGGKNKKERRGKRANKKRKRRCHRSARRNFAG